MLTNSPKTSDLIKRDFFLLKFSQNDEKTGKKCRFHQCSVPVNKLTASGCCEKGTFGHLSNHFFLSQ